MATSARPTRELFREEFANPEVIRSCRRVQRMLFAKLPTLHVMGVDETVRLTCVYPLS